MFLIRAAFWLSLVILFIPGDPESGEEAPRIGAVQALSAAQATFADVSAFCRRNPSVCETRDAAVRVFSDKARNGARMIHDYLSPDDPAADGGTLSEDDREPAWQGVAQVESSV